ncbi:MAG TPA: hypothetical protein DCK95_08710 [Anaerolineaceae bacterium]|uniref:FemAB family protein n=1 Tax=Anaerolinea thermophila TaxID=167964 RepID=A0A101FXZ1_9CHLR|nr:MAG: FemAB family protein [Anaerolinea thermophila]HAF62394.1 hypothetical protein [Anaerolineaceae bacterium]
MSFINEIEWQEYIQQHPEAHILQTAQWGMLKSEFGWEPHCFRNETSAALILLKRIFLGYSIAYIPKGPIGYNWNSMWSELDDFCRKKRCVFLKVEPDLWEEEWDFAQENLAGFKASAHNIQPRQTILIPLGGNEEEWLAGMKQKTRYNIRLAEKKEVEIVVDDRVDIFNELMHATGQRDDFEIHADAYYQRAYDLFSPQGMCALFTAYYDQKPLAGLMAFKQGKRAWYLYGASNEVERNRMPTYLLQWKAMQWAKEHGCEKYDLWGIPDAPLHDLEENFTKRSDGLWGVYRFKRGFGGELKRSAGAWDRVYDYPVYAAYLAYTHKRKLS